MQRLKIAIVGLHFGRHIISRQLESGPGQQYFELAAVCDLQADLADRVASQHNVPAFHSMNELLATDIPVIGLFTGPTGRAALMKNIIRAGKHIITTKPLELDADAALAVLKEAQKLGCVVHLNSPAPVLAADMQRIVEWQKERSLGRPISAQWQTWVRYNEQADGSWYDDPQRCPVAPILRLGIYGVNDVVQLLGEPESVHVMHSRVLTGRPTPDNAQLSMCFKNGALATVSATFCVNDGQSYPDNLTVSFENGIVYRTAAPRGSGGAERRSLRLMMRGEQGPHEADSAMIDLSECSGSYQWRNFYRAVLGEKLDGALTPQQLVTGVRVLQAMTRSDETGRAEAV